VSRRTLFIATLLIASPLRADSLADLRAAVTRLTAREPIRVTLEVRRTIDSQGKIDTTNSSGSASADVIRDAEGIKLAFAQSLIDKAQAEERLHQLDQKKPAPTHGAVQDISPMDAAETIDFSDPLLRMLALARLKEERRVAFQGKPARLLVFDLQAPETKGGVGSVTYSENRLTVWMADDNTPLAAERSQKGSAGILFIKGELTSRETWSFIRSGDHLVVGRYELAFTGSGLGQKTSQHSVRTATVR
jgi:hypothetical protein